MKAKRIVFITSLLVLFGICFTVMNRHYDELARYPYVTSENRDIILEHLSNDDINYMISQQLKPEQFLPYIETEGFVLRNTLWYNRAKEVRSASNETIIAFINDFKNHLDYAGLETLLKAYSYDTLRTFYEEENDYIQNADIVNDPASLLTLIDDEETLYTYQPKKLVSVKDVPHVSLVDGKSDIKVLSEVKKPLQKLCSDISKVNNKTCGNLILTAGYISYEDQVPIYESMMLKYGRDDFRRFWDYPGQSEYQLGTLIRFQPVGRESSSVDDELLQPQDNDAKDDKEESEDSKLAEWLADNAYKYGFIIRYPKDKEDVTKKLYQPFTLRYVGKEVAEILYQNHQTLNEYHVEIK